MADKANVALVEFSYKVACEFVRRMNANDSVHAHNAVDELGDDADIVRRNKNRHALMELLEELVEAFGARRIDVVRRLVEDQQLGVATQRSRDENALSLTA